MFFVIDSIQGVFVIISFIFKFMGFFVYRLNFNDNTGDIHVIGNLIEYKLGELHCEGGSYNELDVLCDDSFVVF